MALFDYLNDDAYGGASSTSSQIALQLQKLTGKASLATGLSGVGSASDSALPAVVITLDAQRAAADAIDGKKTAASLAGELRATLDSQKAAGKASDMSGFSGRALAVVALNADEGFSRTEVLAAKAQLRERDRQSALALISSGGLTAASLKAYSKQMLATRQSMSAEEQQLRDADPRLR